jgi:hypothetical protein
MKTEETRGGKRTGAGRPKGSNKPKEELKKMYSFRLSKSEEIKVRQLLTKMRSRKNEYLDKNSKIKSSLNLKNDRILNSDDIEKIKTLIIDTPTINKYYFEEELIKDKTYKLKQEYRDLSYSFERRKKEGFEEEAFLTYPQNKYEDLTIEVSNLGRIRINGEIAEQNEQEGKVGYLQLNKDSQNKNIKKALKVITEKRIYDMVAKIWLGHRNDDGFDVHHITNNGYDNRVENLILVEKSDHRNKIHNIKT